MQKIKECLFKFKFVKFLNLFRKKEMSQFLRYYFSHAKLKDINYLKSINYDIFYILSEFNLNKYKKKKMVIEKTVCNYLSKKEKIKIAFVTPFLSTWTGDELFEQFLNDDRFEPYILISSFNNGSQETSFFEMPLMVDYFNSKKYVYKKIDESCTSWDDSGKPDIIFYNSPYLTYLSPCVQMENVPMTTLTIYTGYGIYIDKMEDIQFDLPIHNMAWKNYSHTPYYNKIAQEFSRIKGENLIYSGYCKIDDLVDSKYRTMDESELWKISNESQIKIILAPHHSIGNAMPKFGTLDKNYEFFYNYAKNHVDTTTWIFKPHPVLRKTVVTEGLFKSIEEYDEYLNRWNTLPNAKVVTGSYIDHFLTSDCMILDSVSFMAEYLYTNNPMLFLSCDKGTFNEFGEELFSNITSVPGDDFSGIEKFISQVINHTYSNEKAKIFFENHLNYFQKNKMLAREYIFNDIKKDLSNK